VEEIVRRAWPAAGISQTLQGHEKSLIIPICPANPLEQIRFLSFMLKCHGTFSTSIMRGPKSTNRERSFLISMPRGERRQDIDGRLKPGHDWRMDLTDEFRNTLFVLHITARKPRS
jgi:hypothetical protein